MSNILMLNSQRRYFLYRHKTDMRHGFDGLNQLVREEMGGQLLTEDMFIFLNKGRTHIKLLVFEQGGFSLFYRRLEQGTFEVPDSLDDSPSIEVSCDRLLFLLKQKHKKYPTRVPDKKRSRIHPGRAWINYRRKSAYSNRPRCRIMLYR